MKILGFQSGHDVSYCVLENGVPIIHEELERFLRLKEPPGDGLKMAFERLPDDFFDDVNTFCYGNLNTRHQNDTVNDKESDAKMKKIIDDNDGKLYAISHHQSHAANAFFSSNFDEALIITIDGSGTDKVEWEDFEKDTTDLEQGEYFSTAFTFWKGKGTKIEPIKRIPMSEMTLGSPYKVFTRDIFGLSAGYPYGNQAGTVMAMACMGDSNKYWKEFYDSLKRGGGGPSQSNLDLASKFKNMIENESDEKKKETLKFDVSAGIQKAIEVIAQEYMTPIIEELKPKNICMAGGVSLNSVMVGKMYDWYEGVVEKIYVCPVPYDGGLSIGCAQYVYHQILGYPRVKWEDDSETYLGCSYGLDDIQDTLKSDKWSKNIVTEKVDDDYVAELLTKDDNVISVFGGGSESGRRALGNRSILADPRSPDMKDIINEKVKHRQWFRPFAPSITAEDVKDWFERDVESPYMTTVIKFKEEVRDKVPAVVHFDGSARLQTVTKNNNEWYYNFIKKFESISGVPIVLNTSFNDREPIVETPEHAVDCFMRTNIDFLYFREFGILVSKKSIENDLKKSVEIKINQDSEKIYNITNVNEHTIKSSVQDKSLTSELYDFDIMTKGVRQHIDRDYTYDVIPSELEGGYLYQPVHRVPENTKISFDVKEPTDIYVFFHNTCDGMFTDTFQEMKDWELCSSAPQYDTQNSNGHGLKMLMYKLEAQPGNYDLPTVQFNQEHKSMLCFNIVFKPHSEFKGDK